MRMLGIVILVVVCVTCVLADDCESVGGIEGACPIVINFGHGTYRLTGEDAPVTFDFYATGRPVRMGWTAAGTEQAFLCLDRNHSGAIENGGELFGNVMVLRDGRRARNGFEALAALDDNGDGRIDDGDAIWRDLLLWRDLNHDAVSQPEEISRAADSRLQGIDLEYHFSGRVDSSGNAFRYQSRVWMAGTGNDRVAGPVYDVFFASAF